MSFILLMVFNFALMGILYLQVILWVQSYLIIFRAKTKNLNNDMLFYVKKRYSMVKKLEYDTFLKD